MNIKNENNKMRTYEKPTLEMVVLEQTDVITGSNDTPEIEILTCEEDN